jgi:fatty acid desaturase
MGLSNDELKRLQQRSDARGLARLAGHFAAIAGSAFLYAWSIERQSHRLVVLLLAVVLGFTLVTMFAAMHEAVHRTAFKSRWLNDGVGWFAGLLSFYNSTFYRYYHGWHHRFTQIPERDPELEDAKPTSLASYLVEMTALNWWVGKSRTHFSIALGRVGAYGFLNEEARPKVVRSVRIQLGVYALGVALSIGLGEPLFFTYWLLPVALGQPLLRGIVLAEHTGCAENDDPLTNTRTTYTVFPVRFLMWDMPFHAEHHHYPALPFFALADAHESLGPHLSHVARRGYLGFHVEFLRGLRATSRGPRIVKERTERGEPG